MFRAVALIVLFPSAAVADWSPHPMMFSYAAAFDICTADPTAPDLAIKCHDTLTAAYTLKRAVARAAFACGDQDLSDCTTPFEDEGLPAIAVRIATDSGCERTHQADLRLGIPIENSSCIAIASDIMLDEGIVPVDTGLRVGPSGGDEIDLKYFQSVLWRDAITDLSDSDTIQQQLKDADTVCNAVRFDDASFIACRIESYVTLWADLAQRNEQDQ